MHLVEAGRNPQAQRLGTAQANFFKAQPELCYGCHGNIQAQ